MFRSQSEDEIQTLVTPAAASVGYVRMTGDTGGAFRQVRLTLLNCPISITDALAYGGVQIATLPEGYAVLLGAVAKNLTFTTTSAISTTLNSGVTVQYGVGTAPASATTLSGAMLNLIPGVNQAPVTFTSSTVINVASAAVNASMFDVNNFDGSATAIPIYLNIAVPTGGDIDGDATLIVSGQIVLTFVMTGDT